MQNLDRIRSDMIAWGNIFDSFKRTPTIGFKSIHIKNVLHILKKKDQFKKKSWSKTKKIIPLVAPTLTEQRGFNITSTTYQCKTFKIWMVLTLVLGLLSFGGILSLAFQPMSSLGVPFNTDFSWFTLKKIQVLVSFFVNYSCFCGQLPFRRSVIQVIGGVHTFCHHF